MTTATGYTVVWSCYCSDAAIDAELLPKTCPEHAAPMVAPPYRNPMPGGVAMGHCCDIGGPNEIRRTARADLTTHPDPRALGDRPTSEETL